MPPKSRRRNPKKRRCRVCGCTDERACPGGCYWVERDLCSTCQSTAIVFAQEFRAQFPQLKGSILPRFFKELERELRRYRRR